MTPEITESLVKQGIDPESAQPLSGGRNNRVWKVIVGCKPLLLKNYLNDSWPRLQHETSFLRAAEVCGAAVPSLISSDQALNYSLLEFIEGHRPDNSPRTIQAAIDFILTMRDGRPRLEPAKDAEFSAAGHIKQLQARVDALTTIDPTKPNCLSAWHLGEKEIKPLYDVLAARIKGKEPVLRLPIADAWPSPSDFGLHNSLQAGPKTLFFDFEYAGMDDPAKLIVDFCYQPDNILAPKLRSQFQEALFAVEGGGAIAERTAILTPIYLLKWACICLNRFLPSGRNKEAFQGTELDSTQAAAQCSKALKMVELAKHTFQEN